MLENWIVLWLFSWNNYNWHNVDYEENQPRFSKENLGYM